MKPVVIIPSYWRQSHNQDQQFEPGAYDHAAAVDTNDIEQLSSCLDSLKQVEGLGRVLILLAAESSIQDRAYEHVQALVAEHGIAANIITNHELSKLHDVLSEKFEDLPLQAIALTSYGAIKNLALLVAAIFEHDVAVFIDDDEQVQDAKFLINAVYGLGQKTRQGLPVVAKSGYFLDKRNSCYADRRHAPWYDKKWAKRSEFNKLMNSLQSGSRISRSNILCGGCFALHAAAFTRVAFDPWISRGEDQDYLINLRLYGFDVWFDNKWFLKHRPPHEGLRAPRFMQNVYRWVYEMKKLEFARSKIDLQTVSPASLMPYPGPWLGEELKSRVHITAFLRALGSSEKKAYWDIFLHGWKRAIEYAEKNCEHYLRFQLLWPQIISSVWGSQELQLIITHDQASKIMIEQDVQDECQDNDTFDIHA